MDSGKTATADELAEQLKARKSAERSLATPGGEASDTASVYQRARGGVLGQLPVDPDLHVHVPLEHLGQKALEKRPQRTGRGAGLVERQLADAPEIRQTGGLVDDHGRFSGENLVLAGPLHPDRPVGTGRGGGRFVGDDRERRTRVPRDRTLDETQNLGVLAQQRVGGTHVCRTAGQNQRRKPQCHRCLDLHSASR